jgi:hypothetical protein
MEDSRPREHLSQAILADVGVAMKSRCGTNEPRVVQRLNHWYSHLLAGGVHSWRDKGECIVEMRHLGFLEFQQVSHLSRAVPSPYCAETQSGPVPDAINTNFVIGTYIFHNLMTLGSQQISFAGKHFILATVLLV